MNAHLKNKHMLTTATERAPHIRRSLEMQNTVKDSNDVEERKAVKSAETVCEETHDTTGSDALTEFQEKERALSANFREIEDTIVSLRLRAMNAARDALRMDEVTMEVREKLMPLYEMVIESLKTLLYDNAPPVQLKRTNDQRDARSPVLKRKKKRASKSQATSTDWLTWDENAQHDCPYLDELL